MEHFSPKPHVSPALAHLRHGVTACALTVALCAALQMLVFGFVHFTQIRWVEDKTPAVATALRVVSSPGANVAQAREPGAPVATIEQDEPRRVLGKADGVLRAISAAAISGGVAAASLLGLFTILGVVVGAGGAVPGIDRATSACMWASLIVVGTLPWQNIFPSVPFSGVFGPYSTMSSMSDAVDAGGGSSLALLAQFLLMPLAAMSCSFLVLYRFRAGVAEGIIATSVSEIDERLEREMASIRAKGVEIQSSGRAVAALNSAIGEAPTIPLMPTQLAAASAVRAEPTVRKLSAPAPARNGASSGGGLGRERRIGQTDPGDPMKRPI
jgi:hypothetical protein